MRKDFLFLKKIPKPLVMFISQINIKGFRNFPDNKIDFNDGVNVIIGHNNAGKTSLLKALSLLLNNEGGRRLEIDDFSKSLTLGELQAHPPRVTVELTFTQSENEDPQSDDLVTVSNWLISLQAPYEAKLTYIFFLPQEKLSDYNQAMATESNKDHAWLTIKHEFLRFYNYHILGGDPSLQVKADSDSLQKFDFQFLNAIRDVERDLFTGRNSMLRDIFDFFMDYNIKSELEAVKTKQQKRDEIKVLRADFSTQAGLLLQILHDRMHDGKQHILSYAKQTGATFNNALPDFDGTISDVDLYSALKLVIGYSALDIKVPATHNGLGYNNLIFISVLLAKMQVNADGSYLGGNAKVFPVLAIEEPEAHLHPSMQYKFLKFLKANKESRKVRQVFVTTHSTQITSAVSLNEIICLHNENGLIHVGYPAKTFPNNATGISAKAYVQRFLDATRSDMLFAQKIIFVEGLAEQLLLPTLAKYCGKNLEDFHIAIIPVGGRFFDNFLYMFDSTNASVIPKRIACLKDRDPERKAKSPNASFTSCPPFLFNQEHNSYDYKEHISTKETLYAAHPNIRFFGQNHGKGKTFEYELCLENVGTDILITDSIKNEKELRLLLEAFRQRKPIMDFFNIMRSSGANQAVETAITALTDPTWSDDDKKKAIISMRYLSSVGKGENALELANKLEENLSLPLPPPAGTPRVTGAAIPTRIDFNVPKYIKDAIDWICL